MRIANLGHNPPPQTHISLRPRFRVRMLDVDKRHVSSSSLTILGAYVKKRQLQG